ncbi:MAG: glycosyl hydrolase [Pseudomonadota bacterium]
MKDLHCFLGALMLTAACVVPARAQQQVQVGAGKLWLDPKASETVRPARADYRTAEMAKRAVPTNTWFSSLVYQPWSDVLHAHPLTFKATDKGFEMGLPTAARGPISKLKPWAPAGGSDVVVTHRHEADLTIWPTAFTPKDARLAAAGDWNIAVAMADGPQQLTAHISHGSPYAYYRINSGGVRISLPPSAVVVDAPVSAADSKTVRYVQVNAKRYAIYLPPGAVVNGAVSKALDISFAQGKGYFSIAALPDNDAATAKAFLDSAFAFVTHTEVEWNYDEAGSSVVSRFKFTKELMDGVQAAPLVGLYLHQKKWLVDKATKVVGVLPSVRGEISIAAVDAFSTRMTFNGLLPMWPKLKAEAKSLRVTELSLGDQRRAASLFGKMGNGTYWTGKALGAVAQHMAIAEQNGQADAALEMEKLLKSRMENWFSGNAVAYFAYEKNVGSLLGYPEEYFSVSAMNDHHFHYGYWITAAAHVARRDPEWAKNAKWGGMVNLMVKDIANPQRNRPDFPFLRNFDVYEGHSWARGNSEFHGHGNDQESSSEAVNAWAGVALWGEATGDKAIRDLGVYMYVTEVASVLNYWFDADEKVFDKAYGKPVASMVFGGAYGYSTWWTEEPRQILGINLLPITPASVYLANLSPTYVNAYLKLAEDERKRYDASGQSDGTTKDIWQDVYASFLALKSPDAALKKWDSKGSVEVGETRTRTLFWLESLGEMGAPVLDISADTFSYGVFKHPETGQKTYLAYNHGPTEKRVRFSDGVEMTAQPKSIARLVAPR